jgi:hypothetical protein
MVEIVLALGVLGVGVVSVLALFPVGMNASRDAMAESFASNAADQFVHYLEQEIRKPAGGSLPGGVSGWDYYVVNSNVPPSTSKPAADDFTPTYAAKTTLYPKTGTPGLYKVIRFVDGPSGTADLYEPDKDSMDFEAIVVVYQDQVRIPDVPTPLPLNFAAALNVEVSWPARLPYASRQKSIYRAEMFNR